MPAVSRSSSDLILLPLQAGPIIVSLRAGLMQQKNIQGVGSDHQAEGDLSYIYVRRRSSELVGTEADLSSYSHHVGTLPRGVQCQVFFELHSSQKRGTFRSNEGKKAKKFQRGLRQDIHDKVAIFDLCTYRAVLGKGQIVEGLSNNPTPSAGSSRASVPYKRPVPVHGQQDKRQKMVQNAFPRGPAAGQAQTCPHCGRNCGTRPCYCLNNACYKCLSSQHLIQDYPLIKGQTRPAASRRVFDITAQDAEATPDVIQQLDTDDLYKTHWIWSRPR
ncbi:uncharacterized protein LOC110806659 [Carica papaya]|uniref:uncharacterized protein LOC110806659 n=1 Tax=Carica papaya TaxID=3649 RepID=UPI000B8CC47F|nr:uncharacterized protein LOC110806659 [Carica papaya]